MTFGGYFIFKSDYAVDGSNAPARIVTFKTKQKYYPLDGGSPTNKLIVYPYPCQSTTGQTLSVAENYTGTAADPYFLFGGIWNTVTVDKSIYVKNIICMSDYYANASSEITDDTVLGYSEIYSGFINKLAFAPNLGGAMSINKPTVIYKSKTIAFKYSKPATQWIGDAKTMDDAVNRLVDHLVGSGYASTWAN